MPEEIEKILELTKPSATQPTEQVAVSWSARFSRTCAFLDLGSVIIFWLMMMLVSLAKGVSLEEAVTENVSDLVDILLIAEILFLPCISVAVVITAIMGLVGAKRCPGNRKVVVWAIVLTVLAVAGLIVPLLVFILRNLRFW